MSQYFPQYRSSENNVKIELDLSNYVIKNDIKNITHTHTHTHTDAGSFATKDSDKLDLEKKISDVDKKFLIQLV